MAKHLPLRIGVVAAVSLISLVYLYPPPGVREMLYGPAIGQAPSRGILPRTLTLGLDLQGGIHLVLGVDLDKALEAQTERTAVALRGALERKGVAVRRVERQGSIEVAVELASADAWSAVQGVIGEFASLETAASDQAAGRFTLRLRPPEAAALRELAVRQALETIRNRVDQFAVAEPSIQQQGENRILVQLPGVQDPERAKALIGKTALLEFKMLDEQTDPERATREGIIGIY